MMEQVLNFFVSNAYADMPASGASPSFIGGNLPFIIMAGFLLFFYFVVLRPQNKRAKEAQNLINSLTKGDEIVTAGGLMGRITKLTDQYITLSVSNNVDIVMQKSSVVGVLPKGTLKSIE